MTPRAYINLVAAVLGLLLIGAGAAAVWQLKSMAGKLATADARIAAAEKEAKDAKASLDALSKEVVRRAEFDTAIRTARQTVHIKLDQAANEDPVVRAYLDEPIPDGVREALRR